MNHPTKHIICLLAVFFAGVLASSLFAAESPNSLDLDGRELVVSVYKKPSPERAVIVEKINVRIKGKTFRLEVEDADESTPVVVARWDQKDKLVRQFLGGRVHSYKYGEGPEFYLPLGAGELEGREVVVRVYEHWQQDPAAYSEAALRVTGGAVKFSFDDVNESAFVAVFGEDQKDENVKKVLGAHILGWAYKKGLEFRLPVKIAINKEADFCWTFLDALGTPILNAEVEIYVTHEDRWILIGRSQLDGQARLEIPFCLGKAEANLYIKKGGRTVSYGFGASRLRFVVSCDDYGTAVVEPYSSNKSHRLFIPIVPPDSEASERSIWGAVVDPDNNPVSGVMIRGIGFYPLGAGWVGDIGGQRHSVLTDEQGRFRMYLPLRDGGEEIGTLIPPKSEYYVGIKPSKKLDFLPYEGRIRNGQETIITLERAKNFHTFVFEDEKGPITDPNQLRQIELYITRLGKRRLWFKYDRLKDGGMFPLGRYEAVIGGGRQFRFEPIKVTADSPQELVFKLPPVRVYCGQVINGVTGDPMEGVFVGAFEGGGNNLSTVTPEQWNALHALPQSVSGLDKAFSDVLMPVSSYRSGKIVRTNSDGTFEIRLQTKNNIRGFGVFEESYLAVRLSKDWAKLDENGIFELPVARLFPAAKVIVEPWVKGQDKRFHLILWPEWIIDKDDNPAWVQDLLGAFDKDRDLGIWRGFSIFANRGVESFHVPARLNLQIQLRLRHNEKWSPITVAENVNLEQGEVLDLGRVQIKRALTIFADITNLVGEPVEGVPVTACDQYGRTTSNTDANGIAIFGLARNSKGEFVVEYNAGGDANEPHLRQTLPYEIKEPEDANSVFTLRVPDEMLYRLFK